MKIISDARRGFLRIIKVLVVAQALLTHLWSFKNPFMKQERQKVMPPSSNQDFLSKIYENVLADKMQVFFRNSKNNHDSLCNDPKRTKI